MKNAQIDKGENQASKIMAALDSASSTVRSQQRVSQTLELVRR